ncbi:hypothetical protein BDFB_002585 [Asbolus verrucosus]|uniref:Uncharacterized protein n=1 Tax=Asbolus verrucosus TaxID=1661398 RepID=A0A482W8A7_ASBVE|nr:hypothetical protein BDFB_002585 [Asbolus verrucosus]
MLQVASHFSRGVFEGI